MLGQPRRFVLADGQLMFLDGLSAVLTEHGHLVAAAVTTWPALLDVLPSARPDVCVVDAALEKHTSIDDSLVTLNALSPETLIVVLTADDSAERLQRALSGGAVAYIHKTHSASTLLDALDRVTTGEVVIEGSFTRKPADPASAGFARLAEGLTPREAECLALLIEGCTTAVMAAQLGVSPTTVRTHVQAILTKLGAHSRLEAAAMATRYGLVRTTPEFPSVATLDVETGRLLER